MEPTINVPKEADSEWDKIYHSHPGKPLSVHTAGVIRGTQRYTNWNFAVIAALFHDLGKLNLNFQAKLEGKQPSGYSSHAYLSAFTFWCFAQDINNRNLLREAGLKPTDIWRILAIVAHHHGHLPDFEYLLSQDECTILRSYLLQAPKLPVSEYLQQWWAHQSFDVTDKKLVSVLCNEQFYIVTEKQQEKISDKLDYFLETQWAFASLIEADKRDAGDNKFFKRDEQIKWAQKYFSSCLDAKLDTLIPKRTLDHVRTEIRNEAVKKISMLLKTEQRVFSLTAPTGAGKTYTLVALANEIQKLHPNHSIIYGLPFLTITEQVEKTCNEIFCQNQDFVTRIDSRTHNQKLEDLLAELDAAPEDMSDEASRALLQEAFSTKTFDAAFVITTFVQIFETILSNRNATLLKFPNFGRTIFLLDEIQSLPPRLYTFFAAYLHRFCEKFDSYVIFSTATMPAFGLPDSNDPAKQLFSGYKSPEELLGTRCFDEPVFDRYRIEPLSDKPITREELITYILQQDRSCLVVLNTIEDTKKIVNLLKQRKTDAEIILLNTHFTLEDRQHKIARSKELLNNSQRVILVSTQLIEAGVDIDFPIVFRDLCSLPSLIQTAGRCNRNAEFQRGHVYIFELHGNKGESRAKLVYREEPDWFLNFVRDHFLQNEAFNECELRTVQEKYFSKVNRDLLIGQHPLRTAKSEAGKTLIHYINELAFSTIGSFQLINQQEFGDTYSYYVPRDDDDEEFFRLEEMIVESTLARKEAKGRLSFVEDQKYQLRISAQVKKMSSRVVQFRVPNRQKSPVSAPLRFLHDKDNEICGLRCLGYLGDYTEEGICFDGSSTVIL